jgi:hypothetical protein
MDADGYFGLPVASADDVNGDGYADLIVSAGSAVGVTGRAYVYLGAVSGTVTTPSTILSGMDGFGGHFGSCAASAGDVNGDGYADLAIGASQASSLTGRSYVYLGNASGIATTPSTTLMGPDGASGFFGQSIASAGDVNGDGFADLVVSAKGVSSGTGRAYVYVGSASGIATTPSTALAGPDGVSGSFGASVASAGDANGDADTASRLLQSRPQRRSFYAELFDQS